MATLKEIVDRYGYGCEVKWSIPNMHGTGINTYYDIIQKSPLPELAYRLIDESGYGPYLDFAEDSNFQVCFTYELRKI